MLVTLALIIGASFTSKVLAAPSAALAPPAALLARQGMPDGSFTCDGRYLPNFTDCQNILDNTIFPRGNEEFCLSGLGKGSNCFIWRLGNCELSSCNYGPDEFCPLYSVEGTRMSIVIQGCEAAASGGQSNSVQNIEVEVRDNEEFVPSPARQIQEAIVTPTSSDEMNAQQKVKRQQDSDTNFRVFGRGKGVQQPGIVRQVTGRLPVGTTRTDVMGNTETIGFGTEISASSSFLGLVEASVGFNFDFSTEVSNSESLAIPVQCNPGQQGIIEWYPLYDFYQGVFEPSGDELTVWVPLESSASSGNYAVRCLG